MLRVIILLNLIFATILSASSLTGIWDFLYDDTLDGRLEVTKRYEIQFNAHLDQMSGRYINMNNDSNLEIRFHKARGDVLISGYQTDDDFYRVLSGELKNDMIRGTWYSVGGLSGDFSMKKR